MPFIKVESTASLSEDKRKSLLATLSKTVAATLGKPEQYVMASISSSAILMSGQPGEAAFVDLRSIGGLDAAACQKLSAQLCKLLADSLGIPPARVYLNFTDIAASHWGWNGDTFG
jgi:phenylpyruvate tautomerase